jgi:hypothetical protein
LALVTWKLLLALAPVLALELGAFGLLAEPLGLVAAVLSLGLPAAALCPVSSTWWPTLPLKSSVLPVRE